jgi:hypothetical protein
MAERNVKAKPASPIPNDQKVPKAKCSDHPRWHEPTRSDRRVPRAKGVVTGKLSDARRYGQKARGRGCAPPGSSESPFKTLSLKFAHGTRLSRCTTPWLPPSDGGMPFASGTHYAAELDIPWAC